MWTGLLKKNKDREIRERAAYQRGSLFTLDKLSPEVLRDIVNECNNDPDLIVEITTYDGSHIVFRTEHKNDRNPIYSMFNRNNDQ